jgi:hypothetical protein
VPTADCVIALFCVVDERLGPLPKHPQAHRWPSEAVTLGLLYALKGGSFRSFDHWLHREVAPLFGRSGLPERTRLLRVLRRHRPLTDRFLAAPTVFTIIDTYGIELLHPWRYRRSHAQVGKKGWSNHRWIVGLKLCWLINARGEVVAWAWSTANTHDRRFLPLVAALEGRSITLADSGFAGRPSPANLKPCPRGTWNERMLIETLFSLVHRVCHLKYLWHRATAYLDMHLAYVAALVNTLLLLNARATPHLPYPPLRLAQYAL